MIKSIRALAAVAILAVASIALLASQPARSQSTLSIGGLTFPGACTVTGATPQTCNGSSGAVTTGTLTTAAATNAAYVINNSSVVAASRVQCQVLAYSGTIVTNGYPQIISCVPAAGTITVNLTNTHASNALNGTVVIGFLVAN